MVLSGGEVGPLLFRTVCTILLGSKASSLLCDVLTPVSLNSLFDFFSFCHGISRIPPCTAWPFLEVFCS